MHRLLLPLWVLLSVQAPPASSADRPAVAVLPFGVAANRPGLRWLGRAVAASLSEALSRQPAVRTLPFDTVVGRLKSAGAKPDEVAWSSAVASRSLGRWLGADLLLIGAVGARRDRDSASQLLGVSRTQAPADQAEIWMAARLEHVSTGEILGRGFAEGLSEDVLALQNELLAQVCAAARLPVGRLGEMRRPVPRARLSAYRETSEARALLSEQVPGDSDGRKAKRAVHKALRKLSKAIKQDADYANAWGWSGVAHAAAGEWEEARSAYRQALNLDPNLAVAAYGLAEAVLRQGNLDEAAAIMQTRSERMPWDDQAQATLGEILLESGQEEAATGAFRKSLEAWPEQPDVLSRLGGLFLSANRPKDAVRALTAALDMAPGRARDYGTLAAAYLQSGDFSAAQQALEKARTLGLGGHDLQSLQARVALEDGRPRDAVALLSSASAEEVLSRTDRLTLARAHAALGHIDDALATYRRMAGSADPALYADEIGQMLAEAGRGRDAIEVYTRAVGAAPDRADLRMRLAELLLADGNRHGAVEQLLEVVRQEPDRTEARRLLARLRRETGKHKEAARQWQAILDRDSSDVEAVSGLARLRPAALRPGAPSPRALLARARKKVASGDLRGARSILMEGARRFPGNAGLWNDLGTVHARLGDRTLAREAFESALEADPSFPESHYNIGLMLIRKGAPDSAARALRAALDSDENFVPALRLLARIELDTGHPDAAMSRLEKVLRLTPEDADAMLALGNALLAAGRTEPAEETYRRLLSLSVNPGGARIGLGNAALAHGDTTSALALYQSAAQADPGSPAPHINAGFVYLARGQHKQALAAFRQALAIAPSDPALRLDLTVLYYQTGQYEEALRHCRAVLTEDPDRLGALRMVGMVAYAMGQYADAAAAYRMAIQVSPADPQANQGLASAYEALGDRERSARHWASWLELVEGRPEYEREAHRVRERLAALGPS